MQIFERYLTFAAEIIALNIWHQWHYFRRVRNSCCVVQSGHSGLNEEKCTYPYVFIIKVSTKISTCFSSVFFLSNMWLFEYLKVAARRTNSTNISEVAGVIARFSCKRNGISLCSHPLEMQRKMALSWKSLMEPWMFEQLREMKINFLCMCIFSYYGSLYQNTRLYVVCTACKLSMLKITGLLTHWSQNWILI